MNSTDFEKVVARIHEILEPDGTIIIWNDHVSDSSNSKQLRQIDITIHRSDADIRIECRHRKKPENVRWIEEMIGKRARLNLDHIICVSSSGFTKTAQLAASDAGIELKTLTQLTDQEIYEWKDEAEVYILCFKVHILRITLFLQSNNIQKDELLSGFSDNEDYIESTIISYFHNCGEMKLNLDKLESYSMIHELPSVRSFGKQKLYKIEIVGQFTPFHKRVPITYKGTYKSGEAKYGTVERFGAFIEIIKSDRLITSTINFEEINLDVNEAPSGNIIWKIGDFARTMGIMHIQSNKVNIKNIQNIIYRVRLEQGTTNKTYE